MQRGEIWLTDFGSPSGPEQAGIRPAIVLQDDIFIPALTTVLVVPLTSNVRRLATQPTLLIPAGESGLTQASVVLCYHVQVRGKARLLSRLGELSPSRLAEVEDGVLRAMVL